MPDFEAKGNGGASELDELFGEYLDSLGESSSTEVQEGD